jgi:hypothetical protein
MGPKGRALMTTAIVVVTLTLLPPVSAEAAGKAAPVFRKAMGMAYDAARGQVVLFGGYGPFGEPGDCCTVGATPGLGTAATGRDRPPCIPLRRDL